MKVKFLPSGAEYEIEPNQSVLELAQKHGVFIKTVCNGVPNCAECRVRVVEGEYNVLPPSSTEQMLIGTAHFIDQRRLSCQLRCYGDIAVDLSEQVQKQKMEGTKKRLKAGVRADISTSNAQVGNLIDQDMQILREAAEDADRDSERVSEGNEVLISHNVIEGEVKVDQDEHLRFDDRIHQIEAEEEADSQVETKSTGTSAPESRENQSPRDRGRQNGRRRNNKRDFRNRPKNRSDESTGTEAKSASGNEKKNIPRNQGSGQDDGGKGKGFRRPNNRHRGKNKNFSNKNKNNPQ